MRLSRINWTGLGVSLGIVVLTLALLELGTRVLAPHWAPTTADRTFWVYDEQLGWANTKGTTGSMDHPEFSITITHNSQGLRDREVPFERVAGRRRMLLIGSSFSWGFGVEQSEIYAEIVEARYPDWEIVNASVSGYGTDQELLYLKLRGHRFEPDVILLPVHYTDLAGNLLPTRYWHNKPFFERDAGGELALRNQPVPAPSALQRFQKYFFTQTSFFSSVYLRYEAVRGVWARAATAGEGAKPLSREGFELTRDLVLAIDETAKQMGARLIVLLTPTFRDDWTRFISQELSHARIAHSSLADAFADPDASVRLRFANDPHWNAAGHRVVADALEAFLLKEGVLP